MRLDKAALLEALGYEPHPGQLLVHRSKAPRRVLACGVRWGKSTAAAYECVAALLEPRDDALGWVVAPTYDLAERIFARVVAILRKHLRHRIQTLYLREHRVLVLNFGGGTSELRAKSADNPKSLLGEGLDFLVVDEAARLPEMIWSEHLSQRLVDRQGWALLLSTPKGRTWFHKLYRLGQKRRDPACESWQSPSWVNPRLSREHIEGERKRLAEHTFAEQYGAEFLGLNTERCDTCHGPDPEANGIVLMYEEVELARCADCNGQVDAAGRSLVKLYANGRREVQVLVLDPTRDGVQVRPERVGPEVRLREIPEELLAASEMEFES